MFTCVLTTAPSTEPVSTSTLQTYLRQNTSAENALLAGFITSARELFESETNRALITQTWTQYVSKPVNEIYLMKGVVQSISSVQYYNSAGTLTSDNTYSSDIVSGDIGRIWWPNGLPTMSTSIRPVLQIQFVAGYGSSATNVPAAIQTAIMLRAAQMWSDRGGTQEIPPGWSTIVSKYSLGNLYQWKMDRHDHPSNWENWDLWGLWPGFFGPGWGD